MELTGKAWLKPELSGPWEPLNAALLLPWKWELWGTWHAKALGSITNTRKSSNNDDIQDPTYSVIENKIIISRNSLHLDTSGSHPSS
jgi:hypothetical protein